MQTICIFKALNIPILLHTSSPPDAKCSQMSHALCACHSQRNVRMSRPNFFSSKKHEWMDTRHINQCTRSSFLTLAHVCVIMSCKCNFPSYVVITPENSRLLSSKILYVGHTSNVNGTTPASIFVKIVRFKYSICSWRLVMMKRKWMPSIFRWFSHVYLCSCKYIKGMLLIGWKYLLVFAFLTSAYNLAGKVSVGEAHRPITLNKQQMYVLIHLYVTAFQQSDPNVMLLTGFHRESKAGMLNCFFIVIVSIMSFPFPFNFTSYFRVFLFIFQISCEIDHETSS